MITIQDKKIETAIKKVFKDAQLYGTGIISVSILDYGRVEVKNIKLSEIKVLAKHFETNVIKDLDK